MTCNNKGASGMTAEANRQDKVRGCLVGGAVGDALGYAIEFCDEDVIFGKYGKDGITEYELDEDFGEAVISDDTQMTLFSANGLLVGDTRGAMRGIRSAPREYVSRAYQDWLYTQETSYERRQKQIRENRDCCNSWLADVPGLYIPRAPGNTCLFILKKQRDEKRQVSDYIKEPQNDSKGCGGVMRVAPVGLNYPEMDIREVDLEGAEIAAITHGHSLGYMPAAVLTHVIHSIMFGKEKRALKEIIIEARDMTRDIFKDDSHIKELTNIIDQAVELSENDEPDLDNIHRLGEGWVAEEALAIALYCAMRHENDFSAGIIASVNHEGDSDSTGAITGNILGAIHGYEAIEDKWKKKLELMDVILEIADDLSKGCRMTEYGDYRDPDWIRKYIKMQWK